MTGLMFVLFFLLGATIGSFLNVVADRLPVGKSIVKPPSHCPACERKLALIDLVPIFSYLFLRGRCRTCGARIPLRGLLVEVGVGALFTYLLWHFGLGPELAMVAFYCCVFIVLSVIDIEHGILPNKITYPMIVIALIISIFMPPGIKSAAIGGGICLALFVISALIIRGGIGWGDVKLAVLIGIITGYELIFIAILFAAISGCLVFVILLLTKVKARKDSIPFGPFLAVGAMATLLWGRELLDLILDLIGRRFGG